MQAMMEREEAELARAIEESKAMMELIEITQKADLDAQSNQPQSEEQNTTIQKVKQERIENQEKVIQQVKEEQAQLEKQLEQKKEEKEVKKQEMKEMPR